VAIDFYWKVEESIRKTAQLEYNVITTLSIYIQLQGI